MHGDSFRTRHLLSHLPACLSPLFPFLSLSPPLPPPPTTDEDRAKRGEYFSVLRCAGLPFRGQNRTVSHCTVVRQWLA